MQPQLLPEGIAKLFWHFLFKHAFLLCFESSSEGRGQWDFDHVDGITTFSCNALHYVPAAVRQALDKGVAKNITANSQHATFSNQRAFSVRRPDLRGTEFDGGKVAPVNLNSGR